MPQSGSGIPPELRSRYAVRAQCVGRSAHDGVVAHPGSENLLSR
jgi:hypothetical protein